MNHKIAKMYSIGETRLISTRTQCGAGFVIIEEVDNSKRIELSNNCWAALEKEFDNINEAVKELCEKKYVKYFKHIGDGWYVSVTTGFRCVDVRRFYTRKNGDLKPKREGIALRLREWNQVCDLRNQLNDDMSLLLGFSPPVVAEQNDNLSQFLRGYEVDASVYSQLTMPTNAM